MPAQLIHEMEPPKKYRDPQTVIREWLEYLRRQNPTLRISDRDVAVLCGVSWRQVRDFRATDRSHWGGATGARQRN